MPENPSLSILVTGGAGFIGRFLIRELLGDDPTGPVPRIRVLDLQPRPESLGGLSIEWIQGSILDTDLLEQACEGMDLAYHLAAVVDWGSLAPDEILKINVDGTRHLVAACRKAGVRGLVYASSIDAVYDGDSHLDIDETFPYPDRYASTYCESKALAERVVLEANTENLRTAALRPSDVYGPGDPFHLHALVDMARSGFYVRVGDPSKLSMHVFVGNMAYAFSLLGTALMNGNEQVPGKVYFISDGPPSNFFTFFDRILLSAGYPLRPGIWLPRWLMMPVGIGADRITSLLRPFVKIKTNVSRFSVTYICNSFTFSTEAAARDFGFSPKYSPEEAFEQTVLFYQRTKKTSP
jgi:nucleoside-diphosphate-sugar epimerase